MSHFDDVEELAEIIGAKLEYAPDDSVFVKFALTDAEIADAIKKYVEEELILLNDPSCPWCKRLLRSCGCYDERGNRIVPPSLPTNH